MNTLFDNQPEQRKPAPARAKAKTVKKARAPKTEPKKPEPKAEPVKKPGTAVAIQQARAPASPKPPKITSAMSMLAFIGSAAQDNRVDPQKMRELLAIRKELKQEESREHFDAGLHKLQMDLATIKITKRGVITIYAKNDPEHARPPIQSTPYAKYDDLNRIIRPVLHKHGFVLLHSNSITADGKQRILTHLRHKGGHSEQSEFVGEIDASGSKNNVQGRGSTIQYGKRYNTVSLLDIITEEDDDGRQGKDTPISEDQLRQLLDECENRGVDKRKFCEAFKVEGIAVIPASRFEAALATVRQKPVVKK